MQPHAASLAGSVPSRDAAAGPIPAQSNSDASDPHSQQIVSGVLDASQPCSFWRSNLNLPSLPLCLPCLVSPAPQHQLVSGFTCPNRQFPQQQQPHAPQQQLQN
eukprot:2013018-Rhodomonas_salina.1